MAARYLFCTEHGAVIRSSNTKRWWHDARTKAKLTHPEGDTTMPLWLYDLRHTYASLMAKAGADIAWLARQMGHESPKITFDTYIHLYPGSGAHALRALSALISGTSSPESRGNEKVVESEREAA